MAMKLKLLGLMIGVIGASANTFALNELSDAELSQAEGQALMSLSYLAPTDTKNLMRNMTGANNVGFYKLGLEAEVELNANIKNLQLGCGGINGDGKCDIDIKNLSISGLNTQSVTAAEDALKEGSPKFNGQRAGTSAILTNPFLEFAIRNPGSAATREVVGFRASAEQISGLLTAGLENYTSANADGIQSLSGFMRIGATNGAVDTAAGLFGKQANFDMNQYDNPLAQIIAGRVSIPLFGTHGIRSIPNHANTTGVIVASMLNVPFQVPEQIVNGVRNSSALVQNVTTRVASIPLAAPTGCSGNTIAPGTATPCSAWNNDQLMVGVTPESNPKYGAQTCVSLIICLLDEAKFKMGAGSRVIGLNMNITFNQSLSMIHNIPLTGTGGYLSLQQIPILWPGSYIHANDTAKTNLAAMTSSDIAKPGWWMSFEQPVNLGFLRTTDKVDISSALPQVAKLVTQSLLDNPPIEVALLDAIGALVNVPITQTLEVDISSYTQANPARITLNDLQLRNQHVAPNCWGNLKFC